jgi:hypothetical protein
MKLLILNTLVFCGISLLFWQKLKNIEDRILKLEQPDDISNLKDTILVTRYKKDGCEQLFRLFNNDERKN